MKLYPDKTRQILLEKLIYPLDIIFNNYDKTYLIADSYNNGVYHYNSDNKLIAKSYFYNFPIKILIE